MLYCEPFCGSAAVLYVKRPSHAEVLNDLDGELVNFLRTVKYPPRELVRALRLLPNSRQLFAEIIDQPSAPTSIACAVRFTYLSHTSFGGLREHWAAECRDNRGRLPRRSALPYLRTGIYRWAERLARATIDCAPWQECIQKYDSPGTLFYFDPPYLLTGPYHAGPFGDRDWRELRARLDGLKGKFILSADGTATMKLLFRGFHERLTSVNSSLGPNDRRQKELLVCNYLGVCDHPRSLFSPRFPHLFSHELPPRTLPPELLAHDVVESSKRRSSWESGTQTMQRNADTRCLSTRIGMDRRVSVNPAKKRTMQSGTTYRVKDVVQPSVPIVTGTDLPGSAPAARREMTLSGPEGLAENAEVHSV